MGKQTEKAKGHHGNPKQYTDGDQKIEVLCNTIRKGMIDKPASWVKPANIQVLLLYEIRDLLREQNELLQAKEGGKS